jgi:hypothetical protein
MEIDQSIAQLGAELDEWFEKSSATFDSQDRAAQTEAVVRGFRMVKGLDRLKADGFAAISALLGRQDMPTNNERAAELVRGFEFAARLADTLHDELLDTEGQTKVWDLMDAIVKCLNEFGSGRAALAVLFKHPNAGVRASAGAYLIDLMPEQVVDMLGTIEESEHANCAHFRAHWTLLAWRREHKSRFNSLR